MWSTLASNQIVTFTSSHKEVLKSEAGVVVTTYSMLTYGNKSAQAKAVMDDIQRREWGLLILDEVHVVPANTFRRVIDLIRVHAKLGLTATLVREDELVADLNFLIGPKLYEASWQDLAANGFIAKVQPAEVLCPMTPEFMSEYLKVTEEETKRKTLNKKKKGQCSSKGLDCCYEPGKVSNVSVLDSVSRSERRQDSGLFGQCVRVARVWTFCSCCCCCFVFICFFQVCSCVEASVFVWKTQQ
jgi:superfamily II DNA or RNA helicase